ncbi:MAG TPA: methylated-DNA--[protein]-cysteine S-methyltransferase [Pseudonocardiaceae bacterium]|nr:methylated-DNA--[protein]-cysteine S-methyltransferase [Pseudonocardiaceae bacterium]
MNPDDPLTTELATLLSAGPPDLLTRIAATWARTPGPTGDLYVASTRRGVVYVRTCDAVHDDPDEFAASFHNRCTRPLIPATTPPDRARFDLTELSPVEREILLAVLTIPRGQVRPSTWLAGRVGRSRATVDVVLCRNPIPVLIPCHRVISPDGTPGGYVFGPDAKRALLSAEGTNLGQVYELAQHDIHYLASASTGTVCFPTCPNVAGQRHGFRSVAVARAHGYRPCPDCRPETGEVG